MYHKVLVPLDGSEAAESVLPHVSEIARRCETEEVIIFRVCEPPVILADYPQDLQISWEAHVKQEAAHIQQQCRLYLEDAAAKLAGQGFRVIEKSGLGQPAEEILREALEDQVDLIIIASHGHSKVTRWAFGNTAGKVLQASRVPVMLIKPGK